MHRENLIIVLVALACCLPFLRLMPGHNPLQAMPAVTHPHH